MSVIVFKCFFNRVVSPLFMKKPGNEALAVEGETVNLPPVLAYLESQVPEPDGFLVGESLTVADLAVATMFVNYEEARCAVDKSQYPRTYAWVAAMHARPSFAKWIALEAEIIKPVFA